MKISEDPDYGNVDYREFQDLVNPKMEWQNSNWILWQIDECPSSCFDFEKFADENIPNDNWPCILSEFYFTKEKPTNENVSVFSKIWKEIIKSPTIPLDINSRREKLSDAYELLAPYIEVHEQLKKESDSKSKSV